MDGARIYKDIQARTGGEIYIGVVGPVRTGKSTFIKRFMDLMVLPAIEDEHQRMQARDEMPQSAQGKTIMTTEPKFIPKSAISIEIADGIDVKIRLIDCVGFMVEGAAGHMEENHERMVRTPWFDDPIPFKKAAEIGTQKVIRDHSTIGIVITSDGSYGEFERSQYMDAEERTIHELKHIDKPFIVLLNTMKPYASETQALSAQIEAKYQVRCLPVNCDQLRIEDIQQMLSLLLLEFPVTQIDFYTPRWFDVLATEHPVRKGVAAQAQQLLQNCQKLKDINTADRFIDCPYIKQMLIEKIDLSTGRVKIQLKLDPAVYYEMLSDWMGTPIANDYMLYRKIQHLSEAEKKYTAFADAAETARQKGYGVVAPERSEVALEAPVLVKHGNRFGFKIKATAPSIHMIKADIETDIAPIVGSEEQANELIETMNDNQQKDASAIWDTLIFGKTVGQLVEDGMQMKIRRMSDGSQQKMQSAIQKIINDGNGNIIFIII